MGEWIDATWSPSFETGLPRRDRRSGPYRTYVPDRLSGRPLALRGDVGLQASRAERAVRDLGEGQGASGLEGLARFLLRSEAIASSQIEGIAPSPQQIALAELASDEPVRGFSDQARLVANNMTVLRQAGAGLATTDEIRVADIESLHRALLPDETHHGLRTVQNWIGGSTWHPLEAEFVPPPAELVRPLMTDLVEYMNGSLHAPLIQAALVHAQFETIHPFTDGNGRVGRALVHTVLTRRGLTPSSILPVSLVLATIRDRYVSGLMAYRHDDDPAGSNAAIAVEQWIETFLGATEVAATEARRFAGEVAALRESWSERVAAHRRVVGLRDTPRSDSATARLIRLLPEMPLLTVSSAQRALGVSNVVARGGLDELAEANVLTRRSIGRGAVGYSAAEVFDLVTLSERKLASTSWDTRKVPPSRPVPAAPHA